MNARASEWLSALLIPHRPKFTTWGESDARGNVNIEADFMARHAARLAAAAGTQRQ